MEWECAVESARVKYVPLTLHPVCVVVLRAVTLMNANDCLSSKFFRMAYSWTVRTIIAVALR